MQWLIGMKFCTVISIWLHFVMPSKISGWGGSRQKKFRGRKHAKFGSILDDFKVWRQISPERMKVFEIGKVHFLL